MPEMNEDFDFATLAIAHKILTRDQVEAAEAVLQKEMLSGKKTRGIEDVLLEQGSLKAEEVWAIYKARDRLMRDAKSVGRRIGGYEVLETIGEGGLGVVYKAKQISMGREIALKVLHQKWVGDDEFRKRFLVEARLVGRLSHPNLIQVIDVGRYKDTLYYSMEFVDGETVEDVIDREGSMSMETAVRLTKQVAHALEYLKEKKIVHRDVKPGNMMMTQDGKVVKLGDFGFVKSSLDSVLSTEGEVLGTPDYISPEAAMGAKEIDYRSDLYSLGASFYHMLTGSTPFEGSSSSVMEAHIRDSLPNLRMFAPDVPENAVKVAERLMAKEPDDRYQSFARLYEDLDALVQHDKADSVGKGESGKKGRGKSYGKDMDELLAEHKKLKRKIKTLIYVVIGLGAAFAASATALLLTMSGQK